ncbi:hypothetical protein JOL62DRAFT_607065 [Phyllosticta paracitricarpa]|uniref:Uncharacterized protein n=1 Tax=Phyllosticta paracitricarpa TaxID=2016321 RepID=A0ABR1MVN7_9PEZI
MEGWSRGPGDGAAQKSVRSFLIGEAAPRRASSGTNSPSTDARGTLKFHFPTTHDAGPWHSASKHASQARILVGPNDRFQASIHMDRRRRRATGSRGADPSESNVRPPTHNRSVVAVVRKSQQFSGSSTSRMAPIASLQAAHPLVDQNLEPRAVSPRTQAASIFPPRPTASCVRKISSRLDLFNHTRSASMINNGKKRTACSVGLTLPPFTQWEKRSSSLPWDLFSENSATFLRFHHLFRGVANEMHCCPGDLSTHMLVFWVIGVGHAKEQVKSCPCRGHFPPALALSTLPPNFSADPALGALEPECYRQLEHLD